MRIERRAGPGSLETYVLSGDGAEVRLVPGRGGLVTHWSVGGEALLFLDEATLVDVSRNVRGGIPLLFPNAGPLPAEGVEFAGRRISQPQHGLARLAAWEVVDAVGDDDTARISMRLRSSDATRVGFPFDFESELAVSLSDGRLLLEWRFTNTGDVPMPLHAGTHPYFTVPVAQKAKAQVPSKATRLKERRSGEVRPASPVHFGEGEVDVALLDHGPAATLLRGDGSRIELNSTPQLSTLVLWTLPDQPFICVEPWTAPGGALASGEGLSSVAPGASEALAIEFHFVR
ncbi:MAG: aldose epimerase [Myxococcales bacterium]|nr:aldose epimerase [Myxococcales bacterium]